MSLKISHAERDALYEAIVLRLSAFDSIHLAIQREDWDLAENLGSEFADLLQFVRADLGWGALSAQQIPITSPPDLVRRAMTALDARAAEDQEAAAVALQSARREANEAQLLTQTCARLYDWAQDPSTDPG